MSRLPPIKSFALAFTLCLAGPYALSQTVMIEGGSIDSNLDALFPSGLPQPPADFRRTAITFGPGESLPDFQTLLGEFNLPNDISTLVHPDGMGTTVSVPTPAEGAEIKEFHSQVRSLSGSSTVEHDYCREYLPNEISPNELRHLVGPLPPPIDGLFGDGSGSGDLFPWDSGGLSATQSNGVPVFHSQTRERGKGDGTRVRSASGWTIVETPPETPTSTPPEEIPEYAQCTDPGKTPFAAPDIKVQIAYPGLAEFPYPRPLPLQLRVRDYDKVKVVCDGCGGDKSEHNRVVEDGIAYGAIQWDLTNKGSLNTPFKDLDDPDGHEAKVTQLREEIEKLRAEIALLEQKKAELAASRAEREAKLRAEITALEQALAEAQQKQTELSTEITSVSQRITVLQRDINTRQQKLEANQNNIDTKQGEIKELQDKIDGKASAEAAALAQRIEALEQQTEAEQARYESTRQQNRQREQQLIQDSNAAEQALTQTIANRDALAAQAQTLQARIRTLEGQLFSTPLMRDILAAQSRINQLISQLSSEISDVASPRDMVGALRELLSAPPNARAGLLKQMQGLGDNLVGQLRSQCNTAFCQNKVNELQREFGALDEALTKAIENPNDLINPSIYQQLQAARVQLSALLPQLQAAEQAVLQSEQAADRAYQDYLNALRQMDREEQAILDEIQRLQNEGGELNGQLDQMRRDEAIQRELNTPEWKKQIAALRSEIDALFAEIVSLRIEIEPMQAELLKLEFKLSQLQLESRTLLQVIATINRQLTEKRAALAAIGNEAAAIDAEIERKRQEIKDKQKELEDELKKGPTGQDGTKRASGMQNWYIPPPLELILKDKARFEELKGNVGTQEAKLAEARGAKKALQKEAYKIIKKATETLWAYKNAEELLKTLNGEIEVLDRNKHEQQGENSRQGQQQLRDLQAHKAETDAAKAEADRKAADAENNENQKQGFVDDAEARVEAAESDLEQKEGDATEKQRQREIQESQRAAKQQAAATKHQEHEALQGQISAAERNLASIERNQSRQQAAGNTQGAANLGTAAKVARRELKSLRDQLPAIRSQQTTAQANLTLATNAEQQAVEEERAAMTALLAAQRELRAARAQLKSITRVLEEATKRRQEAERAANDLENQSKKTGEDIKRTNKEIAESDETKAIDKELGTKNKAKTDAENTKNLAQETFNELTTRRAKFHADKDKADTEFDDAETALKGAKTALEDFLSSELDKIDMEVVIDITGIDDTVLDDWRADDTAPDKKTIKIKYRGRRIISVELLGGDPDLLPPKPDPEIKALCQAGLAYDKPTDLVAPGKPKHEHKEPETIALWYRKGQPLYELWPPVTRSEKPKVTGTRTRADADADAAASGGGDAEEKVDDRRIMRAADWWSHGGADADKAMLSCNLGGGTLISVGGGGGGDGGLVSEGGSETTSGPQCLAGGGSENDIADMTRTRWTGAQPFTSSNEDLWMMKVPDVPGDSCEFESTIKVEVEDTGYQAIDDKAKGSEKFEHIAGLIGDKTKVADNFDAQHKTELKVQIYDGQHKGLKDETVEWRVLSAAPDLKDEDYGLTSARKKEILDKKTDVSGYTKLDFYLEADYGKAEVEVQWKREGTLCETVTIKVERKMQLQQLDMGFGPTTGWEQGETFFKDGGAIDALANKLPDETDTGVVFSVGLVNDRLNPVDEKKIKFSVVAPPSGVTIDPEEVATRTYGLAWTVVTESPEEAELKLKAEVDPPLKPFTEPPEVEGEQSTKKANQFRIGSEGAYLTVETDEGYVPGGDAWSGTGKLVIVDGMNIPEKLADLSLKIDGLEVDVDKGEPFIATAGEVRWPGGDDSNAAEFEKRGFKFTLKKIGLSASADGLVDGSVEIVTGSEESDKKSVNFSATVGPKGFFGELSDMPEIKLAGMTLEQGANILLDLHDGKDPDPLPNYGDGKSWATVTNQTKQGLLIRQGSIILPDALKGANATPPKLSVKDLTIASAGVSGEVTLKHTISAGMGKLNFSITEVSLKLIQNQPTGTVVKGSLDLPEPYVGEIVGEINVDAGNKYGFLIKTETPISAPQLGMVFHIRKLEGKYENELFSFEIADALIKSESFSDFSVNKFKFDSNGNLDAKLTFDSEPLKFGGGFDIELKKLEFTKAESDFRIAIESGFKFSAFNVEKVNFAIINGPIVEKLEIAVDYDKTPVKIDGELTYQEGLFEGRVGVDAKALELEATFVLGTQKEPDKSTWSFWYVELTTGAVIPLGQSGLSIIKLGGGVGYNYDPPIGSTPGAARKTDTLSLKATLGIGDAPTAGNVFAGRTQMVLVSGRFSINGKVWVLDREQSIFGEGQVDFYWSPSTKVEGFVRMGLGIPDKAGKIVALNGDVGFRFVSESDWEIKSRQLSGSILEKLNGKGELEIKPGLVDFEGDIGYDIYKEVGALGVTLKAQVDLSADATLNITITKTSSRLISTQAFNGQVNLTVSTPPRDFVLAAARIDADLVLDATQTSNSISGSIAGSVDASWDTWFSTGSHRVDIGYKFP